MFQGSFAKQTTIFCRGYLIFFELEKSIKLLQERALELKLSPPGFFNIPNQSKTTPGPQEPPDTPKNRFLKKSENYKKSLKYILKTFLL